MFFDWQHDKQVIQKYILMSLRNSRSRAGQTIFPDSFSSQQILTIRCSWFLGLAFLSAALGALLNPPLYIAIAFLFCLIGLMLLPTTNKLVDSYFNWQIRGGVKRTVVLTSLIVICLIVPQVETNTAIFTKPIDYLENSHRSG